jgi:hypothetical protein
VRLSKSFLALAMLTALLDACSRSQLHSSVPTALPSYRVVDAGKPEQPQLTAAQLAWLARIGRTPYYAHRIMELRYLDFGLPPTGPPLAVFVSKSADQGTIIVDHAGSNIPCNPHYFRDIISPGLIGCAALLPSPDR